MRARVTDGRTTALRQQVGDAIREWREATGTTADELAAQARRLGLGWHAATVGQIETGQRDLKALEVSVLRRLGLDLRSVFDEAALHMVPVADRFRDPERKAARALGVKAAQVVAQAQGRWGCGLTERRELLVRAEVGSDASPAMLKAARRRVMMRLLRELRGARQCA